jgi:hypothetical protein
MLKKAILLSEIESYSNKYNFSFQFWGAGNNNVFIEKDNVEIYSSGGFETPDECMGKALLFIYKILRVPKERQFYKAD